MSSPPVVIITGASRGLGAATARILAEMGAHVVLTARSAAPLETLASDIRAAGGEAVTVPCDIVDPATPQTLVSTALDHFGRLDAIINNAAILEPVARMADADASEWARAFQVNVLAPLMLVRTALPLLRTNNGRVINVSSGAAVKAVTGWGAYCVTKAALNQVNLMVSHEEPAITIIAVRPGVIDTAMQATIRDAGAVMTESEHARFVAHYERGELQPPEVPGRAIALLALYAPHTMSGEFIATTDERIEALAR